MTTLDRDAAVLSDALAAIGGDAIVVSHSWGGSVATLGAIGARGVRHLIYIAAVVTEAGHPTLSPPASVPVKGRETLRPKVIIETDTTTVIDRQVSLAAFYHDVEPSLARQAASRLRPFQKTGYAVIETDAVAAWRTIPTTYVVCADDRMIHPDTQREMAAAAGAEVLEWPSSHSPFLSHPDLVADLVARRAESASS
jgi:pimeloyl-ACP methyl ester carboxylesterase